MKSMTLLRKLMVAAVIGVALVAIAAAVFLASSGPALPTDTDAIIDQVLAAELPDLFGNDTGVADSGGVDIWYASTRPEGLSKGTVLLFAGISSDASAWPPLFIKAMVEAGYQVIRHDPRGSGLSDWLEDWDSSSPYTLEDMADDGVAVLDALGIDRAHIVGVSMGGMVAQQFVIDHPERTLTLTSIMSSCDINDHTLPPISIDVARELAFVALKYGVFASERNTIKMHVASRLILRGNGTYDVDARTLAEQVLVNLRQRRGYNPGASQQQQAAVLASGSRYQALRQLAIPVLIIHGESDPFIPIAHGRKCATLIPGAEALWIAGMGHDLPNAFTEIVVEKMNSHFGRASEQK